MLRCIKSELKLSLFSIRAIITITEKQVRLLPAFLLPIYSIKRIDT